MKILLTGNKGFIGTYLEKALIDQGHSVVGFDLPENTICSDYDIDNIFKQNKIDLCLHVAAIADLYNSMSDQLLNFDVNVYGTYILAEYCKQFSVKMIYISTCCVYSNILEDISIENKTYPQCHEPYATSKLAAEFMLRGIPDLQYVILRIGTTYGINMRESLFTYIALDRIHKDIEIEVHGTGYQTRQLIYIDDLVSGILSAVNRFDDIQKEIINITGENKISVWDTINSAQKAISTKFPNRMFKARTINQRYGQTFDENISIKKAKNLLDWKPLSNFNDMMTHIYKNDKRFG